MKSISSMTVLVFASVFLLGSALAREEHHQGTPVNEPAKDKIIQGSDHPDTVLHDHGHYDEVKSQEHHTPHHTNHKDAPHGDHHEHHGHHEHHHSS